MKTLDEVIKAYEYTYENDPIAWTYGVDVLHYLKEYKEKQKTLEIKEAEYKRGFEQLMVEWSRIKDNPPLTWDELRTMEGKPVWIELLNHDMWVDSEWWVIGEVRKDDIILATYLDEMELCEEDIGVLWNAFRKKRE